MSDRPAPLPLEPPFSIGSLRKVIPKHCFERNAITSLRYAFQDLLMAAILFYIASYIDLISENSIYLRICLWILYWIIQGSVLTGLWVVAHECGHQAFSKYLFLNDFVGCILHSLLLVPYWSWKYSHSQHHSNTDSIERDTVHVPKTKDKVIHNGFVRSPFMRFIGIVKMVTLGWPMYLLIDIAGPPSHKNKGWISHFNPFCELFVSKGQRRGVIASDIALLVALWFYYRVYCSFGFYVLFMYWFIPYLNVNFWLVTITFLQHSDYNVPRYYSNEWTWLRGALGTVDRDYGLFNYLHHHIADTHVLHHIFSKIPHYHATEATKALVDSGLIDKYYIKDNTRWYVALWNSYRDCWFVDFDKTEQNKGITWFQKNLKSN